MPRTAATSDDGVIVHDIDYGVWNYADCISPDARKRERFYKAVFTDLVERGFTVVQDTPLTRMFPRIHRYAAEMQALDDESKDAMTPAFFNQHGFHPDDEMGVRSFLLFLRKQPQGVKRMIHAFRQDADVNIDLYLPGVTTFFDATSAHSIDITKNVFRGIAHGFGEDPGFFDRTFDIHPFADKRCFDYPPVRQTLRCGAHLDFGLATLSESNSPGLQLEMDAQNYAAVCPGPGRIVIWAGKALEIATGGKIRAREHRVVIEEAKRSRQSVIFFQGGSVTHPMRTIGDASQNPYLKDFPLYKDMPSALVGFGEWIRQTDTMKHSKIQFDEAFRDMVRGAM